MIVTVKILKKGRKYWAATNVPGGIGWRIPRDEALVNELRGLCHARAEQN